MIESVLNIYSITDEEARADFFEIIRLADIKYLLHTKKTSL